MKKIFSLLWACCICSLLLAQSVGDTHTETFDKPDGEFSWKQNADCVIKNGVYQISTGDESKTYGVMAFPYYPFAYKPGEDWTLEVSMKKIVGSVTAQWGIDIFLFGNPEYKDIWMDKDGAYGSYGHMPFKISKDFNVMKLVKTGDSLDVYFNGKRHGGGSIAEIPEGHFKFTQSTDVPATVIQYDNIKFAITKKAPAAPAAVAADSDCISYNIMTDAENDACLKKLDGGTFTFKYHPLWKQSKNETGTTTFFEVPSGEFNNSQPLFDKYEYQRFKTSVGRYSIHSFDAEVAEIKERGHNPQVFDFTTNAGIEGKLITVNYVHDGTGLWRYEMYAVIPDKGGFLYSFMDFGCYPKGEIMSGVQPKDESAFRSWATAYFASLEAK